MRNKMHCLSYSSTLIVFVFLWCLAESRNINQQIALGNDTEVTNRELIRDGDNDTYIGNESLGETNIRGNETADNAVKANDSPDSTAVKVNNSLDSTSVKVNNSLDSTSVKANDSPDSTAVKANDSPDSTSVKANDSPDSTSVKANDSPDSTSVKANDSPDSTSVKAHYSPGSTAVKANYSLDSTAVKVNDLPDSTPVKANDSPDPPASAPNSNTPTKPFPIFDPLSCTDSVCVRKCCSEGEILYMGPPASYGCMEANYSSVLLRMPSFSDKNGKAVEVEGPVKVAPGTVDCEFFTMLEVEDFLMLPNGHLFHYTEDVEFKLSDYCFEDFKNYKDDPKLFVFTCDSVADTIVQKNTTYYVVHKTTIKVLLVLSILALLMLVVMNFMDRSFRNMQGLCRLNHSISLLVATVTNFLSLQTIFQHSLFFCITIGVIGHAAYLCTFFWLSIMCFDVWRYVRLSLANVNLLQIKGMDSIYFKYYSLVGWGGPALIMVLSLPIEFSPDVPNWVITPGYGKTRCFVHGDLGSLLLYLFGIMSISFIFNILTIGHTSYLLYKHGVAFTSIDTTLKRISSMFRKLKPSNVSEDLVEESLPNDASSTDSSDKSSNDPSSISCKSTDLPTDDSTSSNVGQIPTISGSIPRDNEQPTNTLEQSTGTTLSDQTIKYTNLGYEPPSVDIISPSLTINPATENNTTGIIQTTSKLAVEESNVPQNVSNNGTKREKKRRDLNSNKNLKIMMRRKSMKSFNTKFVILFWQRFQLFSLMALCWTTEVLSTFIPPPEMWIFTDIINALQGMFLFIFFVRVQKNREKVAYKLSVVKKKLLKCF